MIAKVICTVAIRHRPAIRWRTSIAASSCDSRANRSARSPPRPIVLPSSIPETDSDSSTSEERSASLPCLVAVMRLRSWPTRRVSQTKNGSRISEKIASRQSSSAIATMVATTVVTFDAIEVAVEVTTLSIPPMSLEMRDCTSPVRVLVKKASESRCRWR